jgi:ribulose-5-phosphate 4-epimerase/fuculose-1-phosphate aldolase
MKLLYREQRPQLSSAIREMKAGGLLNDCGGALSLSRGDHILITPTGAPFRHWRVAEEDFVVLDGTGGVVQKGEHLGRAEASARTCIFGQLISQRNNLRSNTSEETLG